MISPDDGATQLKLTFGQFLVAVSPVGTSEALKLKAASLEDSNFVSPVIESTVIIVSNSLNCDCNGEIPITLILSFPTTVQGTSLQTSMRADPLPTARS